MKWSEWKRLMKLHPEEALREKTLWGGKDEISSTRHVVEQSSLGIHSIAIRLRMNEFGGKWTKQRCKSYKAWYHKWFLKLKGWTEYNVINMSREEVRELVYQYDRCRDALAELVEREYDKHYVSKS